MSFVIVQCEPVIDYSVRQLCTKQYHGHKDGCLNYGHKVGCPPKVEDFDKVYDMTKPVYAIVNVFDFKSHLIRMKMKYPRWSIYQLRNPYYWQNNARKQLFEGIKQFLMGDSRKYFKLGYRVESCPEAMGVEITKTLEKVGIQLEWPPVNVAYQVALAGIPIKADLK